jgi:hypothetical protein
MITQENFFFSNFFFFLVPVFDPFVISCLLISPPIILALLALLVQDQKTETYRSQGPFQFNECFFLFFFLKHYFCLKSINFLAHDLKCKIDKFLFLASHAVLLITRQYIYILFYYLERVASTDHKCGVWALVWELFGNVVPVWLRNFQKKKPSYKKENLLGNFPIPTKKKDEKDEICDILCIDIVSWFVEKKSS